MDLETTTAIIRYGQELSTINNPDTGFLSGSIRNNPGKEKALWLSQHAQYIVGELTGLLESSGISIDTIICGTLFQYVFDKVAEITYKAISNLDIDTELSLNEAFSYHEPDLPIHIQQKINIIVPKTVYICSETIKFIDENNYSDRGNWLNALLLLAVSLAINYIMEIDLNDDSELKHIMDVQLD